MAPLACVLCAIDPNLPSLVLPMAQATVIAAPILLRDHVKRGARAVADRFRDAPDGDEPPVDETALPAGPADDEAHPDPA